MAYVVNQLDLQVGPAGAIQVLHCELGETLRCALEPAWHSRGPGTRRLQMGCCLSK